MFKVNPALEGAVLPKMPKFVRTRFSMTNTKKRNYAAETQNSSQVHLAFGLANFKF